MGVYGNRNKIPSGFSSVELKPPSSSVKNPNPNPNNYKITKAQECGQFLLLKINYPNCTNYEGNKILLFKDVTLLDVINQRVIDPHFFKDNKIASPIARFVPTDEGWEMALKLTELFKNEK